MSFVISFDIGGHNLRGALVDSTSLEIKARREVATALSRKYADVLAQLAELYEELKQQLPSEAPLKGVAFSVAGFLNPKEGLIYFSPNFLDWKDLSFLEDVKAQLKLGDTPMAMDNDANCAALAEWLHGHAKGAQDAICLTLGTGLGGGVIASGKLVRGKHGAGSELGHIVVEAHKDPSMGSLEYITSGTFLERASKKTAEELAHAAQKNDPEALKLFENFGRNLGVGLTSYCYIFDPEVIVLGGKISRAFDFFVPFARQEMDKRLVNHPARSVQILPAKLGDDAGLVGAAELLGRTET